MQKYKPVVPLVPCPACGRELNRGLSECPHCGSMTPLRISLDGKSLAKWLVRILVLAAVAFVVKILLLG